MMETSEEKYGRIRRSVVGTSKPDLPIVGNIRIGEKRKNQNGKEYPVSLDYFKATGDYASIFHKSVGEQPKSIEVVFISDDIVKSCLEEWEGRNGQGRKAGFGDGENYWLFDEEKQEYVKAKDEEEVKVYSKANGIKWKVVLTLHFIVLGVRGVQGVWKFRTSGTKSTIENVRNTYDHIRRVYGTVVGIPFDLRVKKVKSDKPNVTSVYPVVSLIPNLSETHLQMVRRLVEQGRSILQLGPLTEQNLLEIEGKTLEIGDGGEVS